MSEQGRHQLVCIWSSKELSSATDTLWTNPQYYADSCRRQTLMGTSMIQCWLHLCDFSPLCVFKCLIKLIHGGGKLWWVLLWSDGFPYYLHTMEVNLWLTLWQVHPWIGLFLELSKVFSTTSCQIVTPTHNLCKLKSFGENISWYSVTKATPC